MDPLPYERCHAYKCVSSIHMISKNSFVENTNTLHHDRKRRRTNKQTLEIDAKKRLIARTKIPIEHSIHSLSLLVGFPRSKAHGNISLTSNCANVVIYSQSSECTSIKTRGIKLSLKQFRIQKQIKSIDAHNNRLNE